MQRKLKELRRSTIVYFANSNAHKTTNSDWLSRGMIEVISSKVSSFIQKDKIKIDLLGK